MAEFERQERILGLVFFDWLGRSKDEILKFCDSERKIEVRNFRYFHDTQTCHNYRFQRLWQWQRDNGK